MYKNLGIDENVYNFTKNIENELKDRFAKIDEVAESGFRSASWRIYRLWI